VQEKMQALAQLVIPVDLLPCGLPDRVIGQIMRLAGGRAGDAGVLLFSCED
jgi:hypothetical protein